MRVINLLRYKEFINESKINKVGPVFHGSCHKFDIFDFDKLGKDGHMMSFLGVHFSESEDVAEIFMGSPDYIFYEVELNVRNPLITKEGDLMRKMFKFGIDNGTINPTEIFTRPESELFSIPYYSKNDLCLNDLLMRGLMKYSKKISLNYKKHLIKQGYDSIKYKNELEKPEINRWDWIAFEPEQIKILHTWNQKPILKSA